METLGPQIRSARLALNWSQDDLADHVGLGQQAVSSWERDKSTPDDATLDLLRSLLNAPLTVAPRATPVRTAFLDHLPLKRLDSEQFFSLAKTLLSAVYSGAEIQAYPQALSGVHFKVTTPQGERIGFRCATSKKFHPASFDKEVKSTSIVADEYVLLLNVQASANVRQRAAETDSWRLWDAHDISDLLVEDGGASLLDAVMDLYFPGLRILRSPGRKASIIAGTTAPEPVGSDHQA
jgi:transcriptional regulator with XRE-family HTH domain